MIVCDFDSLRMLLFFQVMDIVDRLFVAMFDSLNKNCEKQLEAVRKQYPFEPLKVVTHF